jgi:Domain of unknown function (DUF4307)
MRHPSRPTPEGTVTTTAPERIATRYGRTPARRRRSRRTAIIAAVVALAIVAAWAIWSGAGGSSSDTFTDDTIGYTLHGDSAVTVTWEVDGQSSVPLDCAIEADAADHSIVGWKVITVPAGSGAARSGQTDLRTIQTAVTGLISSCWPA